jgi:hypothetical protein
MEKPKIHVHQEEGHFYPVDPSTGHLMQRIPSRTEFTIWAMSTGGYRVDTGSITPHTFFWLSTVEARRQLLRGGYELELTL